MYVCVYEVCLYVCVFIHLHVYMCIYNVLWESIYICDVYVSSICICMSAVYMVVYTSGLYICVCMNVYNKKSVYLNRHNSKKIKI